MFRLPRRATSALVVALSIALAACGRATEAQTTDITGVMPQLAFSMTRANDSKPVGAANYHGKIVLLYFGYTHCPDACPTTLANLGAVLKRLGPQADAVRVLFVTVDPARDTIPVLRSYVKAFGPDMDGLRGDANAVAVLARRYRVIYTVTPASPGHPYSVEHSDALFVFDKSGRPRLVTMTTADTAALAAQIESLNS